MKLYYHGFNPDLDEALDTLATACDGKWQSRFYEVTSGIRELNYSFTKEDDEDGFIDEVLELDAGVLLADPRLSDTLSPDG